MDVCEKCRQKLVIQTSTRENPRIDELSGLGEPIALVGVSNYVCPAHGIQWISFPKMGEYLDIIALMVAKEEQPRLANGSRAWFLNHRLQSAIEEKYPWWMRFYDPAENMKPPRDHWFGYWIAGRLYMEFGARLKLVE